MLEQTDSGTLFSPDDDDLICVGEMRSCFAGICFASLGGSNLQFGQD